MTVTLTDNDVSNLRYQLDDRQIFNDIRVIVPKYTYQWDTTQDPWVKRWLDLVNRSSDTESEAKYGRRTQLAKWHCFYDLYSPSFCDGDLTRYKEPMGQIALSVSGITPGLLIQLLSAKISDQLSIVSDALRLNDTFWLDCMTVEINSRRRLAGITFKLIEARPLELLHVFEIDNDVIDGNAVIG